MMLRCSRWGEQAWERTVMPFGSHHFLLVMRQTPPLFNLPDSFVLSERAIEKKLCWSYCAVWDKWIQPRLRKTYNVAISDVSLKSDPRSEIIHLVFERLDVCKEDAWQGRPVCSAPQSVSGACSLSSVFSSESSSPWKPAASQSVSEGQVVSVVKTSRNRWMYSCPISRSVVLS